jgi:hypothetical protein
MYVIASDNGWYARTSSLRCSKQAWVAAHMRTTSEAVPYVLPLRIAKALLRGFHVHLTDTYCMIQRPGSSCWTQSEHLPSTSDDFLQMLWTSREESKSTQVDYTTDLDAWAEFENCININTSVVRVAYGGMPGFHSIISLSKQGEYVHKSSPGRSVFKSVGDFLNRIVAPVMNRAKNSSHFALYARSNVSDYDGMFQLHPSSATLHPRFMLSETERNVTIIRVAQCFNMRASCRPLLDYRAIPHMIHVGRELFKPIPAKHPLVWKFAKPFRIEFPPLKLAVTQTGTFLTSHQLRLYTPCKNAWIRYPGLRAFIRGLNALWTLRRSHHASSKYYTMGLESTNDKTQCYITLFEKRSFSGCMVYFLSERKECTLFDFIKTLDCSRDTVHTFTGWGRVTIELHGFDLTNWNYKILKIDEYEPTIEDSTCTCCPFNADTSRTVKRQRI